MRFYEAKFPSPVFYIDDNYNVSVNGAHRGIFFDEAITEFIAQYMIKNSKYSQSSDITSLKSRVFYKKNLEVLEKLAEVLKVTPVELCLLIDVKHLKNHDGIDQIMQSVGLKFSFDQLEMLLDNYETCHNAQFISSRDGGLVSHDGTRARGFDSKYVKKANEDLAKVESILAEVLEKRK